MTRSWSRFARSAIRSRARPAINGVSKRDEKAQIKKLLSNARYLLPVHDRPAKIEHGFVTGRLHDQVPGRGAVAAEEELVSGVTP